MGSGDSWGFASWIGAGLVGADDGAAFAVSVVAVDLGMYGADSFLEYSRDSDSSFGPRKKFLSSSFVGASGI